MRQSVAARLPAAGAGQTSPCAVLSLLPGAGHGAPRWARAARYRRPTVRSRSINATSMFSDLLTRTVRW